jgi:hypothetical protein
MGYLENYDYLNKISSPYLFFFDLTLLPLIGI